MLQPIDLEPCQPGKECSMFTTLRGFAVSALVAFVAVGCGCSSGGVGSGGQGSSQNGGVSGAGAVPGAGGIGGGGGGTSTTADSGGSLDNTGAARVPVNHRPTMTSCPPGRGPGISISTTGSCPQEGCLRDGDCTSGLNGRCTSGPFACSAGCSYDECLSDADCSANVPCGCRSSDSDPARNFCATQSNCRIDADCGPDGYCSPSILSLVQNAGYSTCYDVATGYFCHTPNDRCTDDSDCSQGTCNYNMTSQSWSCGFCPPPL
jgi:hypothetical protein